MRLHAGSLGFAGAAWMVCACQTAAVIDVDRDEVVTAGLVGAQRACDVPEIIVLSFALRSAQGRTVVPGGRAGPVLPPNPEDAFELDLEVEGNPVAATIEAVRAVEPDDPGKSGFVTIVADRARPACGPMCPELADRWGAAAGQTAAGWLDLSGASEPNPVWFLASTADGLRALTRRPTDRYALIGAAIETDLPPPAGPAALLGNLAMLSAERSVVAWVTSADDAQLSGSRPPHHFVAPLETMGPAPSGVRLWRAACATKGTMLIVRADSALDALAERDLPGAVDGRLDLRIHLEPSAALGATAHLEGQVAIELGRLIPGASFSGGGVIEAPIDAYLPGLP